MSLTAVTVVSVAPMIRPGAQSPPTNYTITDLGTLGGVESKAFAINSCGQIAGYATLANGSKRPFFRPSSSLINLGVLSGEGIATSLNDSGYVVGYSPDRAFIWHDDNGNNANDSGEMKELMPVGISGSAEDINDSGQVVGFFFDDAGGSLGHESFVWENNNFQTINGTPARNAALAHGINNAGTIVGEDSTELRGWVLRGGVNGVFTDIPWLPGGTKSVAYAVSQSEHVVGAASVDSNANPTLHAFIWTDAGPTPGLKDLGTLAGKMRSIAYNVAIVNGSVQVVGTSYNIASDAQAFVWQDLDGDGEGINDPVEMKDLLSLVPSPSDWTRLNEARSINSSGQIVGFGIKNGETHAFLLTPDGVSPSPCLPNINVSVSPSAVSEDGVSTLTYTFTRSITTGGALVVNFSTTGTADSGDYGISQSGSVTIPANQQSATVVVDPMPDSTAETDETVILTTTGGVGSYNIGTLSSATGTINNDDVTNVSVAVAPASANEDGATDLVYTFTRNSTIGSLTVNFSVGGTANLSTDYAQTGATTFTPPTGTVTFANGSSTATVTINPSTDSSVEPDETVSLTVSGGSGYIVGSPSAATGTITNDDTDVSVTVSPLSVTESDTPNLVYTFTRTGVTTGALTVNFSVSGTAELNTDYMQTGATTFTPSAGSVTFANGSTTATVTVDPTADSTVEPDETLVLTLITGANYNVASPNAATGTITNDDTDVIVTLSPTSVTESGTPNLVYTFTRTGVTTGALTVSFSVAGTATLDTDYSQSGATTFGSTAGTVKLLAGSSSATVTLDPTPDATLEGDENIALTVTSGSGYNVSTPSAATGTITPDAPLVFTEENNGNFAVAIDSVTFVKGPFKLANEWNLTPSDRATRVILITSPLGMTDANLATGILSIHIAEYGQIPLANIEHVGPITGVAGLNASFIIVKLPGDLPNPMPGPNNLTLTVKMGSATSNATILSITP